MYIFGITQRDIHRDVHEVEYLYRGKRYVCEMEFKQERPGRSTAKFTKIKRVGATVTVQPWVNEREMDLFVMLGQDFVGMKLPCAYEPNEEMLGME